MPPADGRRHAPPFAAGAGCNAAPPLQRSSRSTSCCDVHHMEAGQTGSCSYQEGVLAAEACRVVLPCSLRWQNSRAAHSCSSVLSSIAGPARHVGVCSCVAAKGLLAAVPGSPSRGSAGGWPMHSADQCVVVTPCGCHQVTRYCLYCCLPGLGRPGFCRHCFLTSLLLPAASSVRIGQGNPLVLSSTLRLCCCMPTTASRCVGLAGCVGRLVVLLGVAVHVSRYCIMQSGEVSVACSCMLPSTGKGLLEVRIAAAAGGGWDQAPCAQAHSPGVAAACCHTTRLGCGVWGPSLVAVQPQCQQAGGVQAGGVSSTEEALHSPGLQGALLPAGEQLAGHPADLGLGILKLTSSLVWSPG
jgi:hypothetical protein